MIINVGILRFTLDRLFETLKCRFRIPLFHMYTSNFYQALAERRDEINRSEQVRFCTGNITR
jgi:hypothetical protein